MSGAKLLTVYRVYKKKKKKKKSSCYFWHELLLQAFSSLGGLAAGHGNSPGCSPDRNERGGGLPSVLQLKMSTGALNSHALLGT